MYFPRLLSLVVAVFLFSQAARAGGYPKVEDSEFDSQIKITGIEEWDIPFGGTSKFWRIRSFIDKKTHRVSHQLYVTLGYLWHWHFYDTAADDRATPLKVTSIDRDVGSCSGGCSYTEIIEIDLSDKLITERPKGFRIKISAHSGDSEIIEVSPGQIGPQLQAIAQAEGSTAPTVKEPASTATAMLAPVAKINNPGPRLGLKTIPITPEVAAEIKQKPGIGLYVGLVETGTPADVAGLRVGDIILSMAGRKVNTYADASTALAKNIGRNSLSLRVRRDGEEYDAVLKFHK